MIYTISVSNAHEPISSALDQPYHSLIVSKTATFWVLLCPASPPTASAIFRPFTSSVHLMGPGGRERLGRLQLKCCHMLSSSSGSIPCVKGKRPPNVVGMFALSMYSSRAGKTSVLLSTTIFSAVFVSTHDFKYFQIVEKYEGALHTYYGECQYAYNTFRSYHLTTYKDPLDGFRITCW